MAKLSYAEKQVRWAARRAEIIQLHVSGWKPAQIAKRYRITKQRVSQVVNRV